MKFRRAGLAGRADGSQHRQVRISLRRKDLALIPSLANYRSVAAPAWTAQPILPAVPGSIQISQTTRPLPDAAHKRDLRTAANVRHTESS
jgi:hypothetical protein